MLKCSAYEIKYISITSVDRGILNIIHPICPIEENANNGRISVCTSPPTPPTIALRAAKGAIK